MDNGTIGGAFFEYNDEPYSKAAEDQRTMGVVAFTPSTDNNGKTSLEADMFVPDVVSEKPNIYDSVKSGTFDGKPYNFNADVWELMGRAKTTLSAEECEAPSTTGTVTTTGASATTGSVTTTGSATTTGAASTTGTVTTTGKVTTTGTQQGTTGSKGTTSQSGSTTSGTTGTQTNGADTSTALEEESSATNTIFSVALTTFFIFALFF